MQIPLQTVIFTNKLVHGKTFYTFSFKWRRELPVKSTTNSHFITRNNHNPMVGAVQTYLLNGPRNHETMILT